MRISEGNPPLKYERPRLGFNTTRTAGRNEFGLEKVCRRVSGSWSRRNDFTRRLELAPQRPPLPKPQSFGFCRRHSIATRSKRLLCFSRRTDQQTFGEVSDVVTESDVGKNTPHSAQTPSNTGKTPCVTDPASATTTGANASTPRGGAVVTTPVEAGRRDVSSSSCCAKLADVLCRGRLLHRVWSITTLGRGGALSWGCRRLVKSVKQARRVVGDHLVRHEEGVNTVKGFNERPARTTRSRERMCCVLSIM